MKEEQFISGIYNYCDRWCERCTFTSHCQNYDGTSMLTPEETDIKNKAFWETFGNSFKQAIDMLYKAADEHGIDLTQPLPPEEEKAYQQKEKDIRASIKKHPIVLLCKQYEKAVQPFTKKADAFTNKTRELVEHLHLGIRNEEEVVNTVAKIGDCYDIVNWYSFFTNAKFQRALHGKLEGENWEENNGYPKDSDGSAKIAIIAVERSINAWSKLLELLPETEDIALQALSILQQLKVKAVEAFPDAEKFKRPGFDD